MIRSVQMAGWFTPGKRLAAKIVFKKAIYWGKDRGIHMHPVGPMNENDSTLRVSKQSVY